MAQRQSDGPEAEGPDNLAQQFSELFANKGWLNQKLRISYRDQRYWLSCTPDSFCAYRVNEDGGLGPGVPGWPVCMVTRDNVFDESRMPAVSMPAPGAQEWLSILSDGHFELA